MIMCQTSKIKKDEREVNETQDKSKASKASHILSKVLDGSTNSVSGKAEKHSVGALIP